MIDYVFCPDAHARRDSSTAPCTNVGITTAGRHGASPTKACTSTATHAHADVLFANLQRTEAGLGSREDHESLARGR
eukprot:5472476-Pyramimonas_sp.AAC.1